MMFDGQNKLFFVTIDFNYYVQYCYIKPLNKLINEAIIDK